MADIFDEIGDRGQTGIQGGDIFDQISSDNSYGDSWYTPITDLMKGVYTGVTRRVPEMVGKAMQFSEIAPEAGKALAGWATEGEDQTQKKGMFSQAGEMIPASSAIPLGLNATGKVVGMIPHPVAKVVGLGLQELSTVAAPLLFGLSQAQETTEAGEKRVKELEEQISKAPSYGIRADGTAKGPGFLGELPTADGSVSTELGIGVNIGGKEMEVPMLVPTLTKEEAVHLLKGGQPTQEIVTKAVEHAKKRIGEGKSPFLETGELQDELERVKEHNKWAPHLTGGIEAAGETLGNWALLRLLGPLGKPGMTAAGMTLKNTLKPTLGAYAKEVAFKTLPTEILTEMGQNFGESMVERETGIRPQANPWGEAIDAIGPTAIMTLLTGAGGRALQSHVAGNYLKTLGDENRDPRERALVAQSIAHTIRDDFGDPDTASLWENFAAQKIGSAEPIDINMDMSHETLNPSVDKVVGDAIKTSPDMDTAAQKVVDDLANMDPMLALMQGTRPIEQGSSSREKGMVPMPMGPLRAALSANEQRALTAGTPFAMPESPLAKFTKPPEGPIPAGPSDQGGGPGDIGQTYTAQEQRQPGTPETFNIMQSLYNDLEQGFDLPQILLDEYLERGGIIPENRTDLMEKYAKEEGPQVRPPLRPEPIENVSASPIRPTEGWENEPGSMPGEPTLTHENGAIIERVTDDDMVLYEAVNNEGQSLGIFPDLDNAKLAVETTIPTQSTPQPGDFYEFDAPAHPQGPQTMRFKVNRLFAMPDGTVVPLVEDFTNDLGTLYPIFETQTGVHGARYVKAQEGLMPGAVPLGQKPVMPPVDTAKLAAMQKVKPVKSLTRTVIDMGGLSAAKVKAAGFNVKEDFQQHGLSFVFRKNGRGLDDIASELISSGRILPGPDDISSDNYLLSLLHAAARGQKTTINEMQERINTLVDEQKNDIMSLEETLRSAGYDEQSINRITAESKNLLAEDQRETREDSGSQEIEEDAREARARGTEAVDEDFVSEVDEEEQPTETQKSTELFDTSGMFTLSGGQPYEQKTMKVPEKKGERLLDVEKQDVDELQDRLSGEKAKREFESENDSSESGKIEDFGEKIGGARKDTAERGPARAPARKKEDTTPAWKKRFVAMERIKEPGTWVVFDSKTERTNGQTFRSQKEAEEAIPLFAVAQQHQVFSGQNDGEGYSIYRRVGDRKRIKVVDQTFESREEAMKYMVLHAEELLSIKTSFGEEILPVPEMTYRNGPERRTGNATPEMFMETFAPRGIEFGNWNNQEERQQVMNHAYDGLLDLADALGLPPKALMLNGELAIAFGARGQGLSGAKAHYEPGYGVINLTKMKGAGSLAHEWFHAFDHYLARLDTKASSERKENTRGDSIYPVRGDKYDFQSHGPSYKSQLRKEVKEAYERLIEGMFRKAQQYVESTEQADRFLETARNYLRESLDSIRRYIASDYTQYYKNKFGKPASAEQLAEFDRFAEILVEGGDLETAYRKIEGKQRRGRYSLDGRYTNDTLEGINAITKAVRNRQGFNSEKTGSLDKVISAMRAYAARIKMFEDAQAGTEKTKQTPTSYAIEARKMDQARTSDYWSHPHEMAARAFASYVEDKIAEKGGQSDFLVYRAHDGILLPMIDGFVARPYPEGKEREAINDAFDDLIKTLETKQTDKGIMLFSRTSTQSNSNIEDSSSRHNVLKVEGFLEPLLNKLRNIGNVKVVQSVKDIPGVDTSQLSEKDKVYGAYDRRTDTTYIVVDSVKDIRNAHAILIHEVIGHRGVEAVLNEDELIDVMQAAVDAYEGTDRLAKIAKDYDLDLNKEIDRFVAGRELIAHMAESGERATVMQRIIGIIRQALRRLNFRLKWTDTDIKNLIQKGWEYAEGKQKAPGQPEIAERLFSLGVRGTNRGQQDADLGMNASDTHPVSSGTASEEQSAVGKHKISQRELFSKQDSIRLRKEGGTEFVVAPNGEIDFGYMPNDIEQASNGKYPVAPIRLERGGEYGHKHISQERIEQMKEVGYEDELELLFDVAQNYTDIYDQNNDRPFLVKKNGRKKYVVVELQKTVDGDYYGVSTWFLEDRKPKTKRPYEERGDRKLLLHVSRATDSGQSVPFPTTDNEDRVSDSRRSGQSSSEKNIAKEEDSVNPDNDVSFKRSVETEPSLDDRASVFKTKIQDEARAALFSMTEKVKSPVWREIFGSPEWINHPVVRKIVNIFTDKRSERYHDYFNDLIDYEVKDGSIVDELDKLKKKGVSKLDAIAGKTSKEYQLLEKAIDNGDVYHITPEKMEDWFKKTNTPDDVVRVWRRLRTSWDHALDLMQRQIKDLIAENESRQGAIPGFESTLEQLKEALAMMDEWRGSYAPRIRPVGNYVLQGTRGEGNDKEFFRTHGSAREMKALEIQMNREGWTTKVDKLKRLPESTYQNVKTVEVANLLEHVLDKLDPTTAAQMNDEIIQMVADTIRARGYRQTMIHRGKTLVTGYITDPMERFMRYTSSLAGGMSKAEAAKEAITEFQKMDPAEAPELHRQMQSYIKENLRNMEAVDRAFGLAKSIATFKFLGFNLRSLGVNLTAIATTAPPAIHQYAVDGKMGFARISQYLSVAGKDYVKIMTGGKLDNAEEQAFLDRIKKEGYDDPQYTRDAMAKMSKLPGHMWSKMMGWSMWGFGKTEQWNRGTTMLAAYRLARKQGYSIEEATQRAHEASNRAHGVYGKGTLPAWATGDNIGSRIGAAMYTYSKFGHNYVQMLMDLMKKENMAGTGKRNMKAFAWGLMSPVILAGATVFPFRENIMAMFGGMLRALGIVDDPEKWWWDMIREYLGESAERIGRHGLSGAAGVDISGSLSVGVGVPKNFLELLGPIGGLIDDAGKAYEYFGTGQPGRALEKALPTGVANPLRAAREATTGVVTEKGNRVWDETGKPLTPNAGETAARAIGFRGSRQAVLSEREQETKKIEIRYTDRRNKIYEEFRAMFASPNPSKEWEKEIWDKVHKYNKEVIDKNLYPAVSLITPPSIRRQAISLAKPTKKEMARTGLQR